MPSHTFGVAGRRAWALVRAAGVATVVAAAFGAACRRQASCDPKERVNLNFTLKDLTGREVDLASYRGKPLVLNFWATWCGPCKEEIPLLVELANKYKSSGLTVLGISVDDKPEDLQRFAVANNVTYPLLVGLGQDEMLEAFDAQVAVPISWFVAKDGCPAAKHPGTASKDWFDQQMKALL